MEYFERFRNDIVGLDTTFKTPYGEKPLLFADWTASGRASRSVEAAIGEILRLYGNSHSEDTMVGRTMTGFYEASKHKLHAHVNASQSDIAIYKGSGMTGAMHWFQEMLGVTDPKLSPGDRPIVFVTSMEHHSKQTSMYISFNKMNRGSRI